MPDLRAEKKNILFSSISTIFRSSTALTSLSPAFRAERNLNVFSGRTAAVGPPTAAPIIPTLRTEYSGSSFLLKAGSSFAGNRRDRHIINDRICRNCLPGGTLPDMSGHVCAEAPGEKFAKAVSRMGKAEVCGGPTQISGAENLVSTRFSALFLS